MRGSHGVSWFRLSHQVVVCGEVDLGEMVEPHRPPGPWTARPGRLAGAAILVTAAVALPRADRRNRSGGSRGLVAGLCRTRDRARSSRSARRQPRTRVAHRVRSVRRDLALSGGRARCAAPPRILRIVPLAVAVRGQLPQRRARGFAVVLLALLGAALILAGAAPLCRGHFVIRSARPSDL